MERIKLTSKQVKEIYTNTKSFIADEIQSSTMLKLK